MVFVDDNPAERALVRAELPMVAVPELPEDPALYVRALDQQAYFETHAFSDEDRARAEMYRGNARRKATLQQFADVGAFLRDLTMEAEVGRVDRLHCRALVSLSTRAISSIPPPPATPKPRSRQ